MFQRRKAFKLFILVSISLLISTCSSSDRAEQLAGKAIDSLDDVKYASIQIEARGTFEDPTEGLLSNVAGRGSGFIIDPSGIAVTNNHVVSGAATLEVWVGGEKTSYNATVLGVSECSDLALIDIDGENFPYLEWYEGEIHVGIEVYAVGYPLGDPEYTLTNGIVAKEKTGGETPWSSIDNVLQHDATINPGNSGGPLVTSDGKVVGVNFASSQQPGTQTQFYAIKVDEALKIIDRLRTGEDVTSMGINGVAINDGESLFGIWVYSVASGSPADLVGIQPGDIIVTLEGLVLSTDGTMSDYCDVLRTHGEDAVMSIQVLRFETQEVLEGRVNGPPLEVSYSFGRELAATVQEEEQTPSGAYKSFMVVTDNQNEIQMEVPTQWSDINPDILWDYTASLQAAPDLVDFTLFEVGPGVSFIAHNREYLAVGTVEEELDDPFVRQDECVFQGRYSFEKPNFVGLYDLYTDCNGAGGPVRLALVAELQDSTQDVVIRIIIQVVTEDDLYALDHILETFAVISPIL
jgi:serine protease Do